MISVWLQAPLPRRLLFVLGNLAAALAMMLACVIPLGELLADRDREIRQQRLTLARLQAVAAREVSVRSAAKATPAGEGEFLAGKTDGVIAAELQTRLKRMVEAAGAKLRSIRTVPSKTEGQFRYLGSHVEAFGSIAAIQRAIHAIESAKPYLFIASGTIRLAPAVGQAGKSQEPIIDVQLDVLGVMRKEGSEQ